MVWYMVFYFPYGMVIVFSKHDVTNRVNDGVYSSC